MDEILNKLLESELLSEETKNEISEQWTASIEEYKQTVREEVTLDVRAELSEQWVKERDTLIDSVDTFITEALTKELNELKGDIDRFRDLEVEMAEKLVEEKHKLAEEVAVELDSLVDKIDAFLEMRLAAELEELKEDLDIVKQNEFGRKIFEAFSGEYSKSYYDEDSSVAKLSVTESKLEDAQARIAELEAAQSKMIRESKLEKVLSPLTGKKREQMSFVLQNVETKKLEEAYNFFIGRILKEEDSTPAVETKVITEAKAEKQATVLVTGEEKLVEETATKATNSAASLSQLKRLAGI
jgi:hypothetical protein